MTLCTAALLCALVAGSHAQYWTNGGGGGARNAHGAGAMADFGDAAYDRAGQRAQANGQFAQGAQGAEGSEGAFDFGYAGEFAGTGASAGRYEHGASLIAASEHTLANAEESGAEYGREMGFGWGEGSEASQGEEASMGYFSGAEDAGYDMAAQAEGHQASQNGAMQEPVALRQATPVVYYGGGYNVAPAAHVAPMVAPVSGGVVGGAGAGSVRGGGLVGGGAGAGAIRGGGLVGGGSLVGGGIGGGSGFGGGAGYAGGASLAGGAGIGRGLGYRAPVRAGAGSSSLSGALGGRLGGGRVSGAHAGYARPVGSRYVGGRRVVPGALVGSNAQLIPGSSRGGGGAAFGGSYRGVRPINRGGYRQYF